MVSTFRTQSPFNIPLLKRLDAGPQATLTLPDGSTRTLVKKNISNFSFSVSDSTANAQLFIPASGGSFRFEVPGGPDVGPASASTPRSGRADCETWRGGTPGGFVIIQGGTFSGPNAEIYTAFGCTERVEAGRYTVPRDVLASMVPSTQAPPLNIPTGALLVQHFTLPARFTATGLDQGSIKWVSYNGTSIHYQ